MSPQSLSTSHSAAKSLATPLLGLLIVGLLLPSPSLSQPEDPGTQTDVGTEAESEARARVLETETLLEKIDLVAAEYRGFAADRDTAEGDERTIIELQLRKRLLEMLHLVDEVAQNARELDPSEPEQQTLRERTRERLLLLDRRIDPFLDSVSADLEKLRVSRPDLSDEQQKELDASIQRLEQTLDDVFRFYDSHVEHLEALELPSEATRKRLEARLGARAEELAGRLELARQRVRAARKDAEATPGDGALATDHRIAVDQRDVIAASLRTTIDLMDNSSLPTAEYRQLLIEATGEITSDLLDMEVASGLFEEGREALRRWLELRGPTIVSRLGVFLLVLAFFWVLGALTRRAVARLLERGEGNVSQLSRQILVGTAFRVVILVGFFVALSQIGVNVTALLAGLGIAGFIVGFALQDTLGNFASGAMILIYRPYDVGDVIEAGGVRGSVDTMNLVSTKILTFDNQTLIVPNSRIWGDVIRNVTEQKRRRVDLSFGLAHDTQLEQAEALFEAVLRDHPHVLEDPAPAIRVHKLTDTAIEFIVRPWVQTENYWETYWDLNREIKLRLDREGIQLGVPRREVQVQMRAEGS